MVASNRQRSYSPGLQELRCREHDRRHENLDPQREEHSLVEAIKREADQAASGDHEFANGKHIEQLVLRLDECVNRDQSQAKEMTTKDCAAGTQTCNAIWRPCKGISREHRSGINIRGHAEHDKDGDQQDGQYSES